MSVPKAVLAGMLLFAFVPGCGAGGPLGGPRAPEEAIQVSPDDGSRNVAPESALRVRVPGGRLETVRAFRTADGRRAPVPGRISADGLSWRPDADSLSSAAGYTVDVVALDGRGRRLARHTAFTTRLPAKRLTGRVTPDGRSAVGTGMIVSVEFDRTIADRRAVQRAIEVTAEPAVPIAPHWFGSSRLDFRPERYWRPGTRITVALRLRGVRAAPGVYGHQHKTFAFTVGRSQVSVVDAAGHTMRVRRGGRLVRTLPITAGAPETTTYNGKMVVTEMLETTRMNSRTVGLGGEYDIPDVPHAMRLTDSGTFLHGNYWASGVFGTSNISHGCVGLRDVRGGGSGTPAGWFFDHSLIGDVVEVINSDERTVAPDNGLGGWNMSWRQWRDGAA